MRIKENKICLILFTFLILFNVQKVEAVSVPNKGGFECHYSVPYTSADGKEQRSFEVVITRDDEYVTVNENHEIKVKLIDDLSYETHGVDWITQSPATAYNHQFSELTGARINNAVLNYSKITITDFVDESGKWYCPNQIYSIAALDDIGTTIATWHTILSMKEFTTTILATPTESVVANTISSSNRIDNNHLDDRANISVCAYYLTTLGGTFSGVSYDGKNYTFTTDIYGFNLDATKTLSVSSGGCPSVSKLGACASSTSADWYITLDESCDEGYKYFSFYDIDEELADDEQYDDTSTGVEYKQYICQLKQRLSLFTTEDKLRQVTPLDIYTASSGELDNSYNILDLPCSTWKTNSTFSCTDEECLSNLEYSVNDQIGNILYYCQDVYKGYLSYNNSQQNFRKGRYEECVSFEEFYDSLVANGIVSNLLEGCDILSNEFKDKLNLYLNIIKIAGPILAIILGMLDFTKVLIAGDADKEMKDAWKKFKIRLIAAALLFLVPVILSTILNLFIGDEINDNPYCDLVTTSNSQ